MRVHLHLAHSLRNIMTKYHTNVFKCIQMFSESTRMVPECFRNEFICAQLASQSTRFVLRNFYSGIYST